MSTVIQAFSLVLQTDVLIAILLASIYGLVIGSLPGLSATMATALLVPATFYLSPIAAVATIIAASAMAIFSGDIPGALLRIPGTPASAAYTDEAYAMTRKGQPELALGICVWFSALGGIAGTISLMALAPPLAEMALNFSTYEYFWLAFLGLMCATMVARSSPVKAIASMLIGLLVSCVGIENPGGTPRFTFGSTDLLGGIEPIPALVGVFAVSEVMRAMLTSEPPKLPYRRFGSIFEQVRQNTLDLITIGKGLRLCFRKLQRVSNLGVRGPKQGDAFLDQTIDIQRHGMRRRFTRKFRECAHPALERFNFFDHNLYGLIHELPVRLSLSCGNLFDGKSDWCERVLQFMRHFSSQHLPACNLSEVDEPVAALFELIGHVIEGPKGKPSLIGAALMQAHFQIA